MTQLTLYESAKSALAEARRVDEVKEIHDKAEAIRAYAHMANDTQLEADAAELRIRAERRLGMLLTAEKQAGRLRKGRPSKAENGSTEAPISLESLKIDKKLSTRSQKVAGIAERAFEAMVARKRQEIIDGNARVTLNLLKTEDKAARRAERMERLATAEGSLKGKGTYNVIYADPPWQFEPYSRDTGMDRAADNHYPCASTQQICEMPVPDITARDCVLFLWATVPMLPDALQVITAWGFTYKSHSIWNKDQAGTGYWFRNKHELLLVGVKGQIPAPLPGTQFQSVIDAPVKDHSRKPLIFRGMIEGLFPNLPKIELFARTPAKGWGQWGKEAPEPVVDETDEQPMTAEEKRQASLLTQHNAEMEAETPPKSQHVPSRVADDGSPTDPETGEIEEGDGLDIPPFLRRKVA